MRTPFARKNVLCVGECMVELSSLGGDTWRRGFAGDTLNTAWHCRRILPPDWTVSYLTRIGSDRISEEMLEFLDREGIDTRHILREPELTVGLYMINLDAAGERSFSYWRGQSAARRLVADPTVLAGAIASAEAVFFSGITLAILSSEHRETLIAEIAAATADGKLTAFDPNIRRNLWESTEALRHFISSAAAASSLVMPSFDDEQVHFGDGAPDDTAKRYLDLGAAEVIVNNGAKGMVLGSDGRTEHLPSLPIAHVVDATGAGDSFNAGYLCARIDGQIPQNAARAGHSVASAVVGHRGAIVPRAASGCARLGTS
ncbi:sugar kinase [Paracoccus thiocyanatus]|uniref:2-dehydro-3-deoxygluconokinase n=1 Tax=Paracoccus thiocyanatus TaxID=34006 RepID=A0A3D8PF16_9RHOB|nr:sugar kinase [Paracoccus thiocyanatus]RDW14057.1 2-dehydro-3-deoxygluconokinase [Paracoccus thiocyanatus]